MAVPTLTSTSLSPSSVRIASVRKQMSVNSTPLKKNEQRTGSMFMAAAIFIGSSENTARTAL